MGGGAADPNSKQLGPVMNAAIGKYFWFNQELFNFSW